MNRAFTPQLRRLAARIVAVTAIVIGTFTHEASAQDASSLPPSRDAILEELREAKAAVIVPPKRSLIEHWLYRYDQGDIPNPFGAWHGLRLVSGSFAPGAGARTGVGYDRVFGTTDIDRANRIAISAVGAYGTRGYRRAGAGVEIRNIASAPIDVKLNGEYYEYPQEDFFGTGSDSRVEDRTSYLLQSTDATIALTWRPASIVDFGAGAAYLKPRTRSGTDPRFPSAEAVFGPDRLSAFGQEPELLRADISAALDWRDNRLHPHSGGRYGARASNFSDRTLGSFDFRQVEIDLQQYVPLPHRYRVLALHASAILTDTDAGQSVPFYYLPTLGGGQTLRGFREFRFRDRNSLSFSAEYRWEAWWALDAAVFVDAGTVAPDRRGLSLHDLDVSYGAGLRIHSNRAFIARLDLARSREGFIPMLRFEHVF